MNTLLKTTTNQEVLAMSEKTINTIALISCLHESHSFNESIGIDLLAVRCASPRNSLSNLYYHLVKQFSDSTYLVSESALFLHDLEVSIQKYWSDIFGCYHTRIPLFTGITAYQISRQWNRSQLDYLDYLQYSECHSLADNFSCLALINNLSDSSYFDHLVYLAYELEASAGYCDLFCALQDNIVFLHSSSIFSARLQYYYPKVYQVEASNGWVDCERLFEESGLYTWGECEEIWIHQNDLMVINGECYSADYVSEHFYYCEDCDEYSEYQHDHEPTYSLRPYSTNILNVCGNFFYDDKNRRVYLSDNKVWNQKQKPLIFGLELEFFGDEDKVLSSLQANDGADWVLCSDGSVSGECKTLPRTLASWQNDDNGLLDVLAAMKDSHCSGHQAFNETDRTAGIHVHIDRRSLSMAVVKKFDAALHNDKNILTFRVISQRKYDCLHYCCLGNKDSILSPHENNDEKYSPVNYLHSDTFEVRIFNSSLRIDRIRKNIEFLHSMFIWLKSVSYADIVTKSVIDLGYFDYIDKNKKQYLNLNSFIQEKF